MTSELGPHQVNSGKVSRKDGDGYQLGLEKSTKNKYSLAQIDDYLDLLRYKFPHKPPVKMTLEARLSNRYASGTWGFGFWNDPFGMGIGGGGKLRLLPVLPNAAWFFYGSSENYLTLRDDQPGNGFHVKTFRSPLLPSLMSLFALPSIPLVLWQTGRRIVRRVGRSIIKEDGMSLDIDVETWHVYHLSWDESQVSFVVDNDLVFSTNIVPRGRLGVVIWIDNQYFRFDQSGKLEFGTLELNKEQWLEIRSLILE